MSWGNSEGIVHPAPNGYTVRKANRQGGIRMCTSISFCDRGLYGRNLDLEYSFGEQVVIMPRLFPLHFHRLPSLDSHFSMIGSKYHQCIISQSLLIQSIQNPANLIIDAFNQ